MTIGTRVRPWTAPVLPAAVLAAVLGLAGCGEEPADDAAPGASPSTTSAAPSEPGAAPTGLWPACEEVWVDGQRFPLEYVGCTEDGKKVRARPLVCESGQYLFTRGKDMWAVAGAVVQHTEGPYGEDPLYRKAHRACTA